MANALVSMDGVNWKKIPVHNVSKMRGSSMQVDEVMEFSKEAYQKLYEAIFQGGAVSWGHL